MFHIWPPIENHWKIKLLNFVQERMHSRFLIHANNQHLLCCCFCHLQQSKSLLKSSCMFSSTCIPIVTLKRISFVLARLLFSLTTQSTILISKTRCSCFHMFFIGNDYCQLIQVLETVPPSVLNKGQPEKKLTSIRPG